MTPDLLALDGIRVIDLSRVIAGPWCDVLIENFRTGTMESFGLGYDVLAKINPRLIYCSVSAFGRTGPRKDSPGYEALMQAFSGIMSITGEPDGHPVRPRRLHRAHPARQDRARTARGRVPPRDGGEPARLSRRGLPAHGRRAESAGLRARVAVALPELQVP